MRMLRTMNLTNRHKPDEKAGAGSLGHEWFHALDNYFSRMRGKKSDHMTDALDVSLASEGSSWRASRRRQEGND